MNIIKLNRVAMYGCRTAFTMIAALIAAAVVPLVAQAQIKVGVSISETGPAASLGIPQKNTITLLPRTIAGKSVEYVVLDDASDSTTAVRNTRKLISENNVDVIIGSSTTPASIAMVDVASELSTAMISLAGSAKIVEPVDAKHAWVFKTPQNDALMAAAVVDSMVAAGVKTVGFIGFTDAYGQGWYAEFSKVAETKGLKIVANESFARNDTSVTGQVLKIIAANPDAVLMAGAGTPGALPQKALKERGYKGRYYQTHGVANADFLRVCGADCNGTLLPAGPVLVASQLPDSNASKASALRYTKEYETAFGAGTVATFGAHVFDAELLLEAAVPEALKTAQPGTPAFRKALRDALEATNNVAASHGVFTMSKTDHAGLDQRGRVMVMIQNNAWVLQK